MLCLCFSFGKVYSWPNMASGPYNYSYIFKYIIIGDMGVGKSCLLHQFTEKKCKYYVIIALPLVSFLCVYTFFVITKVELNYTAHHRNTVHIQMSYLIELEFSTKPVPDWLSSFKLPGPAESVSGPVVVNCNETCHVSCSWYCYSLLIQSCSDGIGTGS